MGRKLKVFEAQFGFYDTVVAASSQAAALRAWGTHQNLFASGQARITEDPQAITAALAKPETPLQRAVGSKDQFAVKATSLPSIPSGPKTKSRPKAAPKKTTNAPPAKPLADRSKLDKAEKALRELDAQRKAEEATLRREEADLQARKMAAQAAYVKARKSATAKVVEARAAFRVAGGEG